MSGQPIFLRVTILLLFVMGAAQVPLATRASAQESTIQAQFPYSSSAAVEIDPSTGTANYSIPIKVPPGRGAIAPSVALTYNSSQGNGIFGVGWSHTIGYIELSTKNGVPNYDGGDAVQLVLAGSAVELVYDATTSRYYPKIEGGFQNIRRIGSHWEVIDTSGTVFYFGQDSSSRIQDPANPSRVFRWALDRIVDVSGNDMELTYTKDGNWLYPDEIRYSANAAAGLAPYATVRFELQSVDRSDPQWSYHPGFEVRLERLIQAVVVEAQGQHYARYDLSYEISSNSTRSLLTKVDLDQGISQVQIPPVRFAYQTDKGFSQDSQWVIPNGMEFYSEIEVNVANGTETYIYHDQGVRQVDINHDGYLDLVRSISGSTQKVYINNGDFTYTDQPAEYPGGAPRLVESTTPMPLDTGSKMVDINGDGRLDFVQHRQNFIVPQGNSLERRVYLRQDGGWSGNQSQWYLPADTPLMQKICSLVC
ncbi:MAG: FG-GAP-like repeat-containing protein, partial [Candidatus Omnitrophica bacterium]|nr:FG-GAP-like repeat-containing protein [Candidatus Omnitrophota bacterium]